MIVGDGVWEHLEFTETSGGQSQTEAALALTTHISEEEEGEKINVHAFNTFKH